MGRQVADGMCEHEVYDGRFGSFACSYKAKGKTADGKAACGVHLAAERRKGEQRMKEQKRADAKAERRQEVVARLERLEARLGTELGPVAVRYPGGAQWETWYSDDRCQVQIRDLERLADRVATLEGMVRELGGGPTLDAWPKGGA